MQNLPSWAYVGAEVICVKSFSALWGVKAIEINTKLTIRSIEYSRLGWGFYFEEIINKPVMTEAGFSERNYHISGFQPVKRVTQEEDMKIFHPLLKTHVVSVLV